MPAQARRGPDFGNLRTWNSSNLETTKISKMEILKIHVAQNVGKVWISRKKNFPAIFGAISGNFLHGTKTQMQKGTNIFLGGPMAIASGDPSSIECPSETDAS